MAPGSRGSNTIVLVAGLVILVVSLAWANRHQTKSSSGGSIASPNSTATDQSVTAQANPVAASLWTGELILVRDQSIIGRKADGVEHIIYATPAGSSITAVTELAGEHVLIGLAGSTPSVLDLNVRTGATTNRSDMTAVQLTALRPTTSGVATVSFSNAERDFGSTVNLTEKGNTHSLYQAKGATVTALAWRADGDALAIGTQTSVIIVPLTTGDAKLFDLTSPVRSLTWHGSSVLAVTDKDGAVEINPTSSPALTSRSAGFGDVGRDFYEYAPDRFVWLRSASGSSTIAATTKDSVQYRSNKATPTDIATASRLVGFIAQ